MWKPVEIEKVAVGSFDSFPLIINTFYASPDAGRQGLQVPVELPERRAGKGGLFDKGHVSKGQKGKRQRAKDKGRKTKGKNKRVRGI